MGDVEKVKGIFPSAYISEFALEFVERMRDHPDVPRQLEPTVRQAISIPALLSSRYMRRAGGHRDGCQERGRFCERDEHGPLRGRKPPGSVRRHRLPA